MCGIAGIIGKHILSKKEIEDTLNSFKASLYHRGPDDWGEYIGNNSGFLNRRLSIVDIKNGKQPIYNQSKSCGIVYNGEVYNYKELKNNIIKSGYQFETQTDTEVVLKAYEMYGVNSFDKLNGMFAFCLWDNTEECVYLVRDYFGIKPLYVYEDNDKIIFSSELQSILKIPGLELEYNPAGFQDYFCFRYVQAPLTLYKNIRKLESGNYVKIKNGICYQTEYNKLSYDNVPKDINPNEVSIQILKTLEEVVQSQLMGEVPISMLLSGGIDSSIIAYMVKKCGANLKTFNIGFPEDNEFEFSREVASSLGLDHVEVILTVEDIIKSFDEIINSLDAPISDAACFPLYFLAKEIKNHATVVLSGEGGDELFGGYPQYMPLINSTLDVFNIFLERSHYNLEYRNLINNKKLSLGTERNEKYFKENDTLNSFLHYDLKTWVPEDLMPKADKILMTHSLEGRFPFLDKRMFELAASIPVKYKIGGTTTKWILKYACGPLLPDSIIGRAKKGFSVPIKNILTKMKSKVEYTISSAEKTEFNDILNFNLCKDITNQYYNGADHLNLIVWNMFILFSKVIL